MARIPEEVKKLFEEVPSVIFSTADASGQPNSCVVGMKAIIDDETLYMSDQFFNKTLANVQVNDKVAIAFWKDHDAYQIYGTARYVNEGPEFETQAAWVNTAFANMGMPIKTKGGCFVAVDAVYQMAPGPDAGALIV